MDCICAAQKSVEAGEKVWSVEEGSKSGTISLPTARKSCGDTESIHNQKMKALREE